ncbi:MAG TPA: DNA polymerase III subunit alpha [Candidatus Limnocylindrales bacterium]|nr:DNA polymerase III subunit alpha [Candidatus Limnocylindrales bacterium]
MSFVHLHLHTQYSLLDGANKISDLMPKLKGLGLTSVAMTDHGNMFGTVDFYKSAKDAGIKPIIGCEVYVAPRSRTERTAVASSDYERAGNNHLILLAMNEIGYKNLSRLVSQSYKDGFFYKPRIDKEILREWNEGLICLSGCLAGEVATAITADRLDRARAAIEEYSTIFGDRYYLEIQDNHLPEQQKVNDVLIPWSREIGIPLVATNDCHYLDHDDHHAHEVLLCVQTGKRLIDEDRWKFGTDQLFVKGREEMLAAFPHARDAVNETARLAERCNVELEFGRNKFPVYAVPEGRRIDDVFAEQARAGLEERLAAAREIGLQLDETVYRERLESEIAMIEQMQFAGYFLIVADFINWAKGQGIPVGPGRGSAAGSLVSYAMRITDIDPIPYNLLFERFLNPERVSMPDIDVDFCYERRDDVIKYVREKYGDDKVAHIITFGTMKGKAALRDVGRVLDFSFGETDRICKLYPAAKQGRDVKLKDALEQEPKLREIRDSGEREAKLFEYALKLEGLARHVSKHAAGIVISDRPLVEDVPLYVDKDGSVITQFAGPDIEAIGLIKFDFLGLKTLTLIADAVRRVRESTGRDVDMSRLPLDDPAPYRMITRGDTVGIFQLESGGMRKLLTRMKPSCFEDLIAALALYRPGPLDSGMVEEYIQRKAGKMQVRYPDPSLEPILRDTYGVIVYQEQVMQIAQVYAGYSLGQADNLRRVMGKKKLETMQKERKIFLDRALAIGRNEEQAVKIFEQMETFAAYGFNKSHSAAYALVTYQTAWLKVHHPKEFLAALLTLEMDSAESTYKNLADAREHGIKVLPPDVNHSKADFTVGEDAIRFGLGAVKGVGQKAIEIIVAAREEGMFTSLGDFCMRADGTQITRRIIESLIKAGALASIDPHRARLLAGLDGAIAWAERVRSDLAAGQMGLFGNGTTSTQPEPELPSVPEFEPLEVLAYEHDAVGFFISGHPLDRYAHDAFMRFVSTADLAGTKDGSTVRVAGVTNTVKRKNSKKGERYATFNLEDRDGLIEVIAWPDCYRRCEAAIIGREPVIVMGRLEYGEGGGASDGHGDEEAGPDYSRKAQIIADEVIPLPQARRRAAQRIRLRVDSSAVRPDAFAQLKSALERNRGTCRSYLNVVARGSTETEIELPDELSVDPTDGLIQIAEALFGEGCVSFEGVLEDPVREKRWNT